MLNFDCDVDVKCEQAYWTLKDITRQYCLTILFCKLVYCPVINFKWILCLAMLFQKLHNNKNAFQ